MAQGGTTASKRQFAGYRLGVPVRVRPGTRCPGTTDLAAGEKGSSNARWVEDYRTWFANR